MDLSQSYTLLLCVSVFLMVWQLFVKKKQLVHILFAVFCGSIAMMATQKITAETLGHYHYLIGMGACVTCNGSWLLARCLFRQKNPISAGHISLAMLVAVLLVSKQAMNFYAAGELYHSAPFLSMQVFVTEFVVLLKSTLLMLTFWEGVHGWAQASRRDRQQRVVFLVSFGAAVSSVMLIAPMLPADVFGDSVRPWIACYAALFMMSVSQCLITWRLKTFDKKNVSRSVQVINSGEPDDDTKFVSDLRDYIVAQQHYLKPNLKVVNVAKALDVSEYRVSRALKTNFDAPNFNQYINKLRIEHAKSLLTDADKSHWSVLVIGMESGFASVGPFTRSFKTLVGCTPGQFRKSARA